MSEDDVGRRLARQQYYPVGEHGAVKVCLWTKKSIRGEGFCYKQRFYGIESHRCLQMTPALGLCTHNCVFCWRNMQHRLPPKNVVFDDPAELIDGCEEGQRKMLSGFGGIPDQIDGKKLEEAQKPNNAAISLAGEPTLYPRISELISEFHGRGYSTFLVTNGTQPERVRALDELPTQFYLSLDAPSKEIYERIDEPMIADGWSRINETIDLMPSLNTRRVLRLTMVEGINMTNPAGYGRLIARAEADYVEVKAFMFVGGSRYRLTQDNMPAHEMVREFAKKLAGETGYALADEKEESRVVLLKK